MTNYTIHVQIWPNLWPKFLTILLRLARRLSLLGILLVAATAGDTAPSTESIPSSLARFIRWKVDINLFLRLESLYPSLPIAPAPAEYNRLEPGMSLTYRYHTCNLWQKTFKHANYLAILNIFACMGFTLKILDQSFFGAVSPITDISIQHESCFLLWAYLYR